PISAQPAISTENAATTPSLLRGTPARTNETALKTEIRMTTIASQPLATKAPSTKPGTTMLLTAAAYFMVTLDTLVVVTALPSIHRSFGGGIATLQWTVSAYTIAFGAGILTAAALGDRLGRRRVYVVGLALFTAASAACALAPDANLLIAF